MSSGHRLARYVKGGNVEIVDDSVPDLPAEGLLVRTEACGLCSGELMAWYLDRKAPHVLGHEVCGIVEASDDPRFPVGSRVFPHHHAPCLACEWCASGRHVHCPQWKATRLDPGGMAESFAVPAGNLNDTHLVSDLRPVDAALAEPLACVHKSLALLPEWGTSAVVGLGALGLMHALVRRGTTGYDTNPARRAWAESQGVRALSPEQAEPADAVVVCPGTRAALEFGMSLLRPGGTLVLFAPLPPSQPVPLDLEALYFRDLRFATSYSCGPDDTARALATLRSGGLKAEQVVSDFVTLDELPRAYHAMRSGEILKAMVVF